jgi:hypothetical protein
MSSVTYAVAKAKVQADLDLEDEEFIQDSELMGYFNDAIREAEAEIHTLYEDYFLTNSSLALVNGTSLYALPTGIYATKIRAVIYKNESLIYEIRRMRTARKFLDRALLIYANPTDEYKYITINSSIAAGTKIELTPASKETSSTNVTIWYLREVVEVTANSSVIDIPEFINFIYAVVKGKCKQKENAGEMPPDARAEIEQQRSMMTSTLSAKIPDDDNEVVKDVSFYQESS